MQKIKLEAHHDRKRRFTFLASFIIVVTIVLALFQLFLSNRLANYGDELATLATKEKELSMANDGLTKEIAEAGSLLTISEKAQNLSMSPAGSFLVVNEAQSVALLH